MENDGKAVEKCSVEKRLESGKGLESDWKVIGKWKVVDCCKLLGE